MASNFPAYVSKGHDLATQVQEFVPGEDTNEPFIVGDLVYVDISDDAQVKRCGTNPTVIAGISEVVSEDAAALTENGKVPIRILTGADVRIHFSSATTPVAATHVGQSYGVTRNQNGNWQLDTSKTTTNSRFKVVAVYEDEGIFECVPHGNVLQFSNLNVATA